MDTTKIGLQRTDIISVFQGFSEQSYIDPLATGYGFIFITVPQLFIDRVVNPNVPYSDLAYQNLKKDPKTVKYIQEEADEIDKRILETLSYNSTYRSVGFIPLLTNLCRGIDPTELTLDTTESFQTTHGYRQPIVTNGINSKTATQLNIPFQETTDLAVTKLIELWVHYIENISDGVIKPHPNTILNGEIDYLSDIYYLLLGPDGQTIKYFVRWTGCHPVNVPYSRFNYQRGDKGIVDIDITFNCIGGIEHMNPAILEEFNMASLCMNSVSSFNASDVVSATETEASDRFLIKNSILLNPEKLESVTHGLSKTMTNNPLVFCISKEGKSRYVLTFGRDSYQNDNEWSMIGQETLDDFESFSPAASNYQDRKAQLNRDKLFYGTPYSSSSDDGNSETNTGNANIFRELYKEIKNES